VTLCIKLLPNLAIPLWNCHVPWSSNRFMICMQKSFEVTKFVQIGYVSSSNMTPFQGFILYSVLFVWMLYIPTSFFYLQTNFKNIVSNVIWNCCFKFYQILWQNGFTLFEYFTCCLVYQTLLGIFYCCEYSTFCNSICVVSNGLFTFSFKLLSLILPKILLADSMS